METSPDPFAWSDDDFLTALQSGQIANHAFHHRDHLRLAYLQIRPLGLAGASDQVTHGIRHFADHHGRLDRYARASWRWKRERHGASPICIRFPRSEATCSDGLLPDRLIGCARRDVYGSHEPAYAAGMERSRAEPEVLKLASATPSQRSVRPASPMLAALVGLQRAAGNQATAELVQELQRRGPAAPQAAHRSSLRVLDHLRVQRAVASWAGSWDTLHYKTEKDPVTKAPLGVNIAIEFDPGDKVDATGIGIVQGVVSADLGIPLAVNKAIGARSIAKGPMKGFHIDQLDTDAAGKDITNPLYPSAAAKKGDELGTTAVVPMKDPGGGRHGWRFVDKAGKENKLSAQMNDAPVLPGHGANAKQIFETTAMAFSGHQAGTYYGSVRWGWATNAKGKFHRLPFTLLSNDAPTKTFATTANLWNTSKNISGAAHIRLPMALGRWTNVDDARVVKNPAKAVDTELAKLGKNTALEVTTKGAGEKFNKGKDHWWKVTVTEGPHIGLVGWSLAANLGDKKVP